MTDLIYQRVGGVAVVEYEIVWKEQFTVMGKSGMFDPATSHIEIPKF